MKRLWRGLDSFDVAESSWSAFQAAMDLATDHNLQIWDALTMAVAAEHWCRLLVSEDLQNGFIWQGVTVVNPLLTRSRLCSTMCFKPDDSLGHAKTRRRKEQRIKDLFGELAGLA